MQTKYIVGIDLGTTNSAVAYANLYDIATQGIEIKSFEIPQVVTSGRVANRPTLPSFLYLPDEKEFIAGEIALPWDNDPKYCVGAFARDFGTLNPLRLVSSAKSWLCHSGIDRESTILPFGIENQDIKKISPVEASKNYLLHIKNAWNHVMGRDNALEKQYVVLTVPASFDEVARELTLKAANEAGLKNLTLIEEPLAAFYSWLSNNESNWNDFICEGDTVLVCDVGGGTTDFTLISCHKKDDKPLLERIAVGDHLLLGGDNIDITITHLAEKELNQELGFVAWQNLLHQSRQAKEKIFSEEKDDIELKEVSLRIQRPGKSLVGGTTVINLKKDEIVPKITEGFFPVISFEECLKKTTGTTGIREMGLPFEDDPCITRHIGSFIARHSEKLPDIILFNGGTLKPEIFRKRIIENLSLWKNGEISELPSKSLDLAISLGAAYYGLTKHGIGLRVGGGIARSYYLGLDTGEETQKSICLIPQGTLEGEEQSINRDFKIRTNSPVKFSLYTSTVRHNDKTGDIIAVNEDIFKLPPLQTFLKYGKSTSHNLIDVNITARLTETGIIEIFCNSLTLTHKWKLQFQLKQQELKQSSGPEGVRVIPHKNDDNEKLLTDSDKEALEEIKKHIEFCFSPQKEARISPKDLPNKLNEITSMPRENWGLGLIRGISDQLLIYKDGMKLSNEHENRWLNLCGFCLRPGIGERLDPWRIKKAWTIFLEGLKYPKDNESRKQWWIYWRRISAGLTSGQQSQIFNAIKPFIISEKTQNNKQKTKKTVSQTQVKATFEEKREMWLLASFLQKLDPSIKTDIGDELLDMIIKGRHFAGIYWAFSRIGERVPVYCPIDKVIPYKIINLWLNELKKAEHIPKNQLLNLAISFARLTGDRFRDLPLSSREDLKTWLISAGISENELTPIFEIIDLKKTEIESAFGEGLPEGLVLESPEE